MFYPIRWIRPRLRSFCVVFGVADVTLVMLSTIGWYFFFDIGYQAQQDNLLLQFRGQGDKFAQKPPLPDILFTDRGKQPQDHRRIRRTVRACGLAYADADDDLSPSFGIPGALIGISMGGYAVLGALLAWLRFLELANARKLVCTICLIGEILCTLFLSIAIIMLFGNESLCPTEYYFEGYQPLYQTFIYTMISIFSYKTYEITVIIFYLAQQNKLVHKEEIRRSLRRSAAKKSGMGLGENNA